MLINAPISASEDLREEDHFLIKRDSPAVFSNTLTRERIVDKQLDLIKDRQLTVWGIALLSGTDPFSLGIRTLTASKWSHVGLILADEKDEQYCFESTGSATEILFERMLPQVQIHKWIDVVNSYSGSVAMRRFTFEEDRAPNHLAVTKFVTRFLGVSYEKNLSELLNAVKRQNKSDDLTSIFCSELSAECLIELNYLPKNRPANNYLPRDFAETEFLPLINATLGQEILIKNPKSCCAVF